MSLMLSLVHLKNQMMELMEDYHETKKKYDSYDDEDIEEITLHSKIVFPLGIILTELLTNIMKYAFNDTLDARITIKVSKNSEKITMIVEDNGRGLPPDLDTENPQGFGLTLVKMLTMQINGTFSIRSSNGTRSIVEFPL